MAEFSVSPDESTDEVVLTPGDEPALPHVLVQNDGTSPVPPQTVTVALPAGRGLRFENYELTVQGAGGETTYAGVPSPDLGTLTFYNVDPDVPGRGTSRNVPGDGAESAMWVAVRAAPGAPADLTSLTFTVGDQTSQSASVNVVEPDA